MDREEKEYLERWVGKVSMVAPLLDMNRQFTNRIGNFYNILGFHDFRKSGQSPDVKSPPHGSSLLRFQKEWSESRCSISSREFPTPIFISGKSASNNISFF